MFIVTQYQKILSSYFARFIEVSHARNDPVREPTRSPVTTPPLGRIFLSQVISAISPKDRKGHTDTIRILTNRSLAADTQISDFDTQLGSDRIAKTKRPTYVFLPVVLLFSIHGGFPAITIASTRCCPEPWAKGLNEVSLE
ncbi:MAG: hypothetical protein WBG51_08850, partial [Syntrophobacteria bacterium]